MERDGDSFAGRAESDGSVDVNGDGLSGGVFMGSQNIALYDITTQRKRRAGSLSFQMDLSEGSR